MKSKVIIKRVYSLFKKDRDYWNSYYMKNPPNSQSESLFAQFVSKYVQADKTIIDLGCGNGRDSFYFSRLGLNVLGIDASDTVVHELNKYTTKTMRFLCGNFINEKTIFFGGVDYYYSRFTVHAIDEEGEKELFSNIFNSLVEGGKFFIEVRGIHDEKYAKGEKVGRNTYMLDGHYRRFVDINELLISLIEVGFSVKYAAEEKGFAPYNDEDSEIIRVVVEKI